MYTVVYIVYIELNILNSCIHIYDSTPNFIWKKKNNFSIPKLPRNTTFCYMFAIPSFIYTKHICAIIDPCVLSTYK